MIGIDAVLADIDGLGQPFRVRADAGAYAAEADVTRFLAADLADAETGEALRMADLHADFRRMPRARHATSLVFQRYSHRVCGVAVAAWVRHRVVLDLAASNVVVRFAGGTPDGIELRAPQMLGAPSAEELVRIVLDEHLIPVAHVLSAARGPRMPNLIGNAAAGFAGAFRTLSKLDADGSVADVAERFMRSDPRLARGGSFRVLDGPRGARLQYDRASCCHWYAAPDGKYCSWCSRLTADERTARYLDAMAGEQ